MTTTPIPPEIQQAISAFAQKVKEVAGQGHWPTELEAQTTLILETLINADEQTLEEFMSTEELFERSHSPEWIELPEGHTRRDRARRMACCIQGSFERAQDRRETQADPWTCPRCLGDIPMPGQRGAYEGAVSRTSELGPEIRICSPCGQEEAYEQASGCLTPQSEWPIESSKIPPRLGANQYRGWKDTWEEYRSSHRRVLAPPPVPREVPDLRLYLMERWIPGGMFEKSLVARGVYERGIEIDPLMRERAEGERNALRYASLWWVRDEMVNLTINAAKSMPDDVRGDEVKLPGDQPYGLAVLATPWIGLDSMDSAETVRVDAIVWARTVIDGGECISLSMYRYFDFAGGLSGHDMQEAMVTGAIFDAVKEPVGNGPPETRSERLRGGSWIFMGRSDWPLKETLSGFEILKQDFPEDTPYTPLRMASMIEDRKFFTAFCVLVNHKLSETEMVWAPRSTRKRAEKAGVDPHREPSHVRMIRLREVRRKAGETDAEHEKRKVEYSHRWMVRGHMAWRRCGPGFQSRRLVPIAPYPKGPEDKELIIKDNVWVWMR